MTVPQKAATLTTGEIMENVLIKGDLSKLTPEEKSAYYNAVCESIGLNPLTRPFEYITLSGKHTLYAKRDAADQLRKINGISIAIVSQDVRDGLLTIHVRAKDRDGREDEDLGVVAFPDTLRGEARANTMLKAVTKAKRRVTLSISGLGFLDETEVTDIPAAAKKPVIKPNVLLEAPPPTAKFDPETGEILADSPPDPTDAAADKSAVLEIAPDAAGTAGDTFPPDRDKTAAEWDLELAEAATHGMAMLEQVWNSIPATFRTKPLKAALDRRHKPNAAEADKANAS